MTREKKIFQLAPSPFCGGGEPVVHVAHGQGAYANTLAALKGVDLAPARGKRIMLKPNAGRIAEAGAAINTDPQVVAAAIDAFRAAGAEVRIGESPITGVATMEAFEVSGIAAVARERDCPLIDMDERRAVDIALPEGRAIKALRLCSDMLDVDLVVSIPVIKMHMHTGVTLAVKNMKGCLWRRSKVVLHMLPACADSDERPLNIAIADMSWALRPHLSIIDGTMAMEGIGPSAGQPHAMDVVVVGADAYAADAVVCRLIGTQAEDIPHLRIGAERGYGVIDLERIKVLPDHWLDWARQFERPPENLAIEFEDIEILDRNSCSACQSTLLLFVKKYGATIFEYFEEKPVHIAIGKGHEAVPPNTLCIGNCMARHKDKGIYVKGCPPISSQILRVLDQEKRNTDTD